MLHIYYGDMENVVFNTVIFFKNVYKDEWITDPLSAEIILDIDKSKVLGNGVIESPVLGLIAPTTLSGGAKTLILIKNRPDKVFNATNCCNNCAKWLLKFAEDEEVTINLRYLMDFGRGNFDIHILNKDIVVHSMEELIPHVIDYI